VLVRRQLFLQQRTRWRGHQSSSTRHSTVDAVNRKVKSFKQTVFLSKQCAALKVTTNVQSAVFQHWHRSTIVLLLVYCSVDNTLFEVSPEICCSGVSSRYCCYGNHTAGYKQIKKLFITSMENWIKSLSTNNNY